MIAPVRPFTVTGQAGKPIASAPVSLEKMGMETGDLNLTASDIDTFNFSCRKTETMTDFPLPESGQTLSLIDGNGKRLFTGTAIIRPRIDRGRLSGYQATVNGPMQWMKDTAIETMVTDETGSTALRPQISFPQQTLGTSITQLFTLAAARGCPFVIGDIPETMTLPPLFYSQVKFFDVISKLLSFIPDSAAVMDYSVAGPPRLNITRRADSPTTMISFGSENHHCLEMEMEPLIERRPDGVKVMWVEREAITYKPFFVSDSAGATTGRIQNVVISGEETGIIQLENYESVDVQTVNAASLSALLTFAIARDPFLKGLASTYGASWYNDFTVSGGVSTVYYEARTANVEWMVGMTTLSVTPNPVSQIAKDGTSLSTASWFAVQSSDRIPDWFPVALQDGKLSFDIMLAIEYDDGETLTAGEAVESFFDACYFKRLGANAVGGAKDIAFGLYQVVFDVTFLNAAYSSLTTVYQPPAFEFTAPPSGLAAALFNAQNFLPWDGRAEFTNRLAEVPSPGMLVSADCDVPEWSTAQAAIASTSMNLLTGRHDVRIGSPSLTTASDLMDQFRRAGIVNVTAV